MPDLNDYHAFVATSKTAHSGKNDSGGPGCSGSVLTWIYAIWAILWLIRKLSR